MLLLNFVSPGSNPSQESSLLSKSELSNQKQWTKISNQFWETLNPTYMSQNIEIHAPYIITIIPNNNNDSTVHSKHQQIVDQLQGYYSGSFTALRQLMKQRSKQSSVFDAFHPYLLLAYSVNIPSIILLCMLIGIMMWMTPFIREKFMLPFLRKAFVRIVTCILRILSSITPIKTDILIKKVENEYNEDGMHLGAISLQSRFNILQNQDNVRNVAIKTLTGMHIADIRAMHVSGNLIASVGQQDGKIVLWDKSKGEWIARLDKLKRLGGGLNGWVAAEKNRKHHNPHRILLSRQNPNKKHDIKQLSHARCIQIDLDEKYIVAGFEYGLICLWNADTAHLIRELTINQDQLYCPVVEDRVIRVFFIEIDDKIIANTKPQSDFMPLQQDKHILSVHKNGKLREWDIKTGDMTQCIDSGHTREITQVYLIPNNQKIDTNTFYIITASKDGTTKCWSRTHTQWTHLYTLNYQNIITSIAAHQLHNGMGILVTGSNDGAVQVWNLDSGAAICTLSKGGIINKKLNNAASAEVGGPLLQFSTVARSATSDDRNSPANSYHQQQHLVKSDHSDAVSQVVITRISNPEFENDTCTGCNAVINSGFLVASCALDESVHAWRLNRTALNKKDVGCTRCAKDYHRRQQPLYNVRTRPTSGPVSALRSKQRKMHTNGASRFNTSGEESEGGPVYQQQQQQQQELKLSALFLGKLSQEASCGLVFCDNMVLAGCRRRRIIDYNDDHGDWEAWFSSLQYYEPPPIEEDASLIPVITFDLEKDADKDLNQSEESSKHQEKDTMLNIRDQVLLKIFGIKKVRNTVCRPNAVSRKNVKSEPISAAKTVQYSDSDSLKDDDTITEDDNLQEEDYDEAFNALPFSTIRCIVPINGNGFSCDYGNFIKIVTFGKNNGDDEVNSST